MIWAATPSEVRPAVREGVVELVGPAGVIEEVGGGQRHVDVAALLDRLARVHRLDDRELAGTLLEDAGDAIQVLGPLGTGQPGPGSVVRPARRRTARSTSADARPGDLRQDLLGGRIDGRERGTAGGGHAAPADEQAVARPDPHDVARLGCRRVLPRDRLAVPEPPAVRGPAGRGSRGPGSAPSDLDRRRRRVGWRSRTGGAPPR